METASITTPLSEAKARSLRAGQEVRISGVLFTARDAAHKRLCESLARKEKLPVDLAGQIIYFAGPSPAKPGKVIGGAGPTTSYRMDAYSPVLIRQAGLRGMIGKGNRSAEVIATMKEKGAVYFAAIGGAAALLARSVKKAEIVAYEDLGAEAIRRLEVRDFPAIVAIDCGGNDLYESGPAQYRRNS
jgi:fumarate hydratase subunit beta